LELTSRDFTEEEKKVLKERLNLIAKVNIAITILAIVWFMSIYFSMKDFISQLWILLAVFPSLILIFGCVFLYFAGSKIRRDYKAKKIYIMKAVLTRIFFKKKRRGARYFIQFGEESFEIDEAAFEKLNGFENYGFAVHFTLNSRLVFKIERI